LYSASQTTVKIIRLLGLTIALIVSLVLPATFTCLLFSQAYKTLQADTHVVAHGITSIIHNRPDLWSFETLRLKEAVSEDYPPRNRDERELLDEHGQLIVATDTKVGILPFISHTEQIYDAGKVVSEIRVKRPSLRLFSIAGGVWFASLAVGFIFYHFVVIRLLRLVEESLVSLQEEKAKTETTLKSIRDGVITVDNDNTIVFMNHAAEKLTGSTASVAVGRQLEAVYRAEEMGDELSPPDIQLRRLRGEYGAEKHVEEVQSVLFNEERMPVGRVVVFRDVTETLVLKREQLRSRQLESIGLLAGGIAHDFNNLLQGVFGYVSLAASRIEKESTSHEMLERALEALSKTTGLTRQLLTFSKGGLPVKRTLELRPLITNSVQFCLSGSNIDTLLLIDEDLWPVDGDEGQLGQVIQNLVINGMQAMPGGGTITVRASNTFNGSGSPDLQSGRRYVNVSITDTGIGISERELTRIFEPYFTTKQSGYGLGLTTSYSIVKNHDGTINVTSEVGSGTTFTVLIPAATERQQPPLELEQPALFPGKVKILVMDDEELVRQVAHSMIEALGHTVETAADGEEAVEKYRRAIQDDAPFQLVMLDITIKGGVGGVETLKKLVEIDQEVKAVVSSGYSNDETVAEHLNLGFVASLSKPYTLDKLKRVLAATL